MNPLVRLTRFFTKRRFRLLCLATIKDIPTAQLNSLLSTLLASGWQKTYEYDGFDAWIDYGRVDLKRGRAKLTLEWDNWTEGSVEGRLALVEEIARGLQLPVTRGWRWSEYDEP